MALVNIIIDGKAMQVEDNLTVLEAARLAKVNIPTLCYLKEINEIGACRICVVEVKGARALQAACVFPVSEGLEILTNSSKVREARKITLDLILSNHDRSCLTCKRNNNCELQTLSIDMGIEEIKFMPRKAEIKKEIDNLGASIVRDANKCVLCRRCVAVCKNVQTVAVIDTNERGIRTQVSPAFEMALSDTPCVNCGQCIAVCPVAALTEKDEIEKVWDAINDPEKYVIVQTAPAVRVAIGEEFGMPIGTRSTGKMVAGLKMLGFDKVFDTDTAADLTIMEEGTELLNRIKNGGKLPLITSCSPGWIKFCEHNFPDMLDNLSSCKSPHEMFGAMLKTYFAEKIGVDPSKIFVVSIMPCTAKKFEAAREELAGDVDVVLTTREAARMMKQAGVKMNELDDAQFDDPMGEATGAAVIFGATGGVMEAAVRTVYEILEGKPLADINLTAVRGTQGIKEASLDVAGMTINVAIASGLANARSLMESVRDGEKQYHFIEVMACPGGCVNGGGQPIQPADVRNWTDLRSVRASAIYEEDESLKIRKSHENPVVMKMYEEFLGEPGSHKAHHLLHTKYAARSNY
ncbi:MAG: NADH-dependent [FeFe] hydrogenase, group A6 [Bacillota bacterium]